MGPYESSAETIKNGQRGGGVGSILNVSPHIYGMPKAELPSYEELRRSGLVSLTKEQYGEILGSETF